MRKSVIIAAAAALCAVSCTLQADKFDYKQEIALIT